MSDLSKLVLDFVKLPADGDKPARTVFSLATLTVRIETPDPFGGPPLVNYASMTTTDLNDPVMKNILGQANVALIAQVAELQSQVNALQADKKKLVADHKVALEQAAVAQDNAIAAVRNAGEAALALAQQQYGQAVADRDAQHQSAMSALRGEAETATANAKTATDRANNLQESLNNLQSQVDSITKQAADAVAEKDRVQVLLDGVTDERDEAIDQLNLKNGVTSAE